MIRLTAIDELRYYGICWRRCIISYSRPIDDAVRSYPLITWPERGVLLCVLGD